MAIHVETIGSKKDSVRGALSSILPKLNKALCAFELRLVPALTYKTDENLASRLKRVAIKHSQITSNTKAYEIEGINNIDNPLPNDPSLTLRKLIMNLKTEEGEKFAITITHNWNGALELWVKKKYRKFSNVVANHLPACLCESHGSSVLPLLSAEHQKIAVDTA